MNARISALIKNGRYSGLVTPNAWHADFEEIRRVDHHAEALSKGWIALAVGGFVVAAMCLVLIHDPEIGKMAQIALGLGIVAGIVGVVGAMSAGKQDYENRRYELAGELMQLLEADLAPKSQVSIRLDLRKVQTAPAHTSKTLTGWDETHYVQPFLIMQGKLCDGTGVALHLVQHERVRTRWKMGTSGKMKHKKKTASWLVANVKLKVDPERAHATAELAKSARPTIQLPKGVRYAGTKVTRKGVAAQAWAELPWSAPAMRAADLSARDMVAMLLVSMFQLLGQAEGAKARSA